MAQLFLDKSLAAFARFVLRLRNRRFRVPVFAPGKSLLARKKAGKVTAANVTAVRRGTDSQQRRDLPRRIVILFRPGVQLGPVTARASSVTPIRDRQHAGLEARVATSATELILPKETLKALHDSPGLRNAQVSAAASWTLRKCRSLGHLLCEEGHGRVSSGAAAIFFPESRKSPLERLHGGLSFRSNPQ